MTSRFKFVAYDPKDNTLYTPACIDLLLHMDGDLQMLAGDRSIVGIVNVPELHVFQRLNIKDIKAVFIDEGSILKMKQSEKQSAHGVVVWSEKTQSFEIRMIDQGIDIRLPLTKEVIFKYGATVIGHKMTDPEWMKEGESDGLPDSQLQN